MFAEGGETHRTPRVQQELRAARLPASMSGKGNRDENATGEGYFRTPGRIGISDGAVASHVYLHARRDRSST